MLKGYKKGNIILKKKNYYIMKIISKGNLYEILFDNKDLELIQKHTWSMQSYRKDSKDFAIVTHIRILKKRKKLYLGRYLMNVQIGMIVDHINHNTLDNRRKNLRIITHRENTINSKKRNNQFGVTGIFKLGKFYYAILTANKISYKKKFTNLKMAIKYRYKLERKFGYDKIIYRK